MFFDDGRAALREQPHGHYHIRNLNVANLMGAQKRVAAIAPTSQKDCRKKLKEHSGQGKKKKIVTPLLVWTND